MAEGTIRRDVVPKTKIRKFKYYNCPRCPCGQCTRKRLRRAHADVTSYGRGYDRRDVVSKTQIRKFKYYNCPRCPCGQCTRKRLRRAHAVDYRRHERWWATPVVEVIKTSSQFHEVDQESCGFRCFSYFVHGPPLGPQDSDI